MAADRDPVDVPDHPAEPVIRFLGSLPLGPLHLAARQVGGRSPTPGNEPADKVSRSGTVETSPPAGRMRAPQPAAPGVAPRPAADGSSRWRASSDPRRQRRSAPLQTEWSENIPLQERLERPAGDRLERLAQEHVRDVRVAEGRRRFGERQLLADLRAHRVPIRKVIIAPAIRAVADHAAGVNQQVTDADVAGFGSRRVHPRYVVIGSSRRIASLDLLHHQGRGHRLRDRRAPVTRRVRRSPAAAVARSAVPLASSMTTRPRWLIPNEIPGMSQNIA